MSEATGSDICVFTSTPLGIFPVSILISANVWKQLKKAHRICACWKYAELLYFWAHGDRLVQWSSNCLWSSFFHRERPVTTGKQMLMRHLTFNSITLPLCPLLLCGITVSPTGKTGSLRVHETHNSVVLHKTHTLTKVAYLSMCCSKESWSIFCLRLLNSLFILYTPIQKTLSCYL